MLFESDSVVLVYNKDICAGCAANEDIFCNYNCTPKYRKDKLSVFFKPLSNGN